MRYRKFGRTGWEGSEIGFGAWAIGADWGQVSEADTSRSTWV
jgi:aryl-alcohol dehydrogenase-like predicted oxidoreductase